MGFRSTDGRIEMCLSNDISICDHTLKLSPPPRKTVEENLPTKIAFNNYVAKLMLEACMKQDPQSDDVGYTHKKEGMIDWTSGTNFPPL